MQRRASLCIRLFGAFGLGNYCWVHCHIFERSLPRSPISECFTYIATFKMRLLRALIALSVVAGSTAQDLVSVLQSDPDLSTLLGAIQAVPGLADTLNAAANITVFAPTNSAFANVSADSLEGQTIANSDINGIASILSYHVVPASIPASAITADPQFVQTLLTSDNDFTGASATLVTGGQYLGAQLVDGASVVLNSGLLATSKVTQAVSIRFIWPKKRTC